MNSVRKTNKRILFAWTIFLSLLILCAQGVTLHVHSFDHNPFQNHHSIDDLNEHSHLNVAHLSIDPSHDEHHNNVPSEMDASPDCILNQVATNVTVLAILTLVLMLILPVLCQNIFFSFHFNISRPWRCYFFPQLRAPPL